jgi:hypothetical protein
MGQARRERSTVELGIAQRLNVGWRSWVLYGTGSAARWPVDLLADRPQERQHRARPADAVQSDDVGARSLQTLARLRRCPALSRRRLLVDRQRDDRRQAGLLHDLERVQRLLSPREGLTDHVVDVRVHGPADLLLEHRPHGCSRARVGDEHVGVREVTREQGAGR